MQKDFYHSGEPYLHVLQRLFQALQKEHAVVQLQGQAGSGKSILCHKLSAFLQRKDYEVIRLSDSLESVDLLHASLARALDIPVTESFAAVLSESLKSREASLVLIIDDAQLLTDLSLFELLRLVSFCNQDQAVVQLLLVTDQDLVGRIQANKEFTEPESLLNEQIELSAMSLEELRNFTIAFFAAVERNNIHLAPDAQDYLFKLCKGFPGPARQLLGETLQWLSSHPGKELLNKTDLVEALKNKAGEAVMPSLSITQPTQRNGLIPVAAVFVIASLAFLYQQLNTDSESPGTMASDTLVVSPSPFAVEPSAVFTDSDADRSGPGFDSIVSMPESAADEPADIGLDEPGLTPERIALARELERQAALQEQMDSAVSDSGLALVTAAERGVAPEEFSLPEFEALLAESSDSAEAEEAEVTVTNLQPVIAQEEEAEPLPANSAQQDAGAQELIISAVEEPQSAEPELTSSPEQIAESTVLGWVNAWETQSLAAYFAYYHDGFEPRYHDSLSAWRSNRERVIGNASFIDLEVSEFEIISAEEGQMEVQFLLSYASASYRDETLKKLVLVVANGEWLILEEVNIEVRVLSG